MTLLENDPASEDFDPDLPPVDELALEDEEVEDDDLGVQLSEDDEDIVRKLVVQCLKFTEELSGTTLYDNQVPMAYRLWESMILGDGEEITIEAARQSGKSFTIARCYAAMMVILPRLAEAFPTYCGKFKRGVFIGVFGPVEDQGATIWGAIVDILSSDAAKEMMLDPEIDDDIGKGKNKGERAPTVYLKNSGSYCRLQSANPRSRIESKTYHLITIDEAQDVESDVVERRIRPMLASTNGTMVLSGTPANVKMYFYKQIQHNKRRWMNRRGRHIKKNHLGWTWKEAAAANPLYAAFIKGEKRRLGEQSQAFRMSYCNYWPVDQGMFVTEDDLEGMFESSMPIVKQWWHTPVLVGIDVAKVTDSTVVTVLWVDWNHPDEFGFHEHRILNWLEIPPGRKYEDQYQLIVRFLANYNILRVGVDGQGMGGPMAERLGLLMPRCEVKAISSDPKAQNERWTYLEQVMHRPKGYGLVVPGHSKARRLKTWVKFSAQMLDVQKVFRGKFMQVEAPDERGAFDDFVDSLALGVWMSKADSLPEMEVNDNFLMSGRRRR